MCALRMRMEEREGAEVPESELPDGRQRHVIADLWRCDEDTLRDERAIRKAMIEAVEAADGHVVDR
jgi:S-adenosylmethionine/arginine decarboxylase-like enzyme